MKFVFDLDGTICFQGKPMTERIVQALEALSVDGHEVIFASARPIRDMLPVVAPSFHHYPMIGGNGSLIAINQKVVQSSVFSKKEWQAIRGLIEEHQVTYLIDSEWDYAYTGDDSHPIRQNIDPGKFAKNKTLEALNPIVKVLFLTANKMDELVDKLIALDVYVNRHDKEKVLDISPKGVHKWSALQRLGIEEKSYIVFGNDANDQSLFMNAHYGVQVGNHPSLLPYSNEKIALADDYEQVLVERIRYLGKADLR